MTAMERQRENERYRRYYAKNKDGINAKRREHYHANIEREHLRARKYYLSHKEQSHMRTRRWRMNPANRAKEAAYNRAHPEIVAAAMRRYRARLDVRMMQDAELYASIRTAQRVYKAKKCVLAGRAYVPRCYRRIPDWATKGMRVVDPKSAYLAVNNTDAHRYFAMMLAVERKEQRRKAGLA